MKRDFDWGMELMVSKKVPVHRLVTHRFPLGEIAQSIRNGRGQGHGIHQGTDMPDVVNKDPGTRSIASWG